MEQKIISLLGQDTEIIVKITDVAEIVYWGTKLKAGYKGMTDTFSRTVPHGRLDTDVAIGLNPELARGQFGSPGFEGHHNGLNWSPVLNIEDVIIHDNSISIYSIDDKANLGMLTELVIDKSDVVKMRQTLTNSHHVPYSLTRISNTMQIPERAQDLMTFYGRWLKEFQQDRIKLNHNGYQQENRRGRTSHQNWPAFIAGTDSFNEVNGEVWGFHLAWSGNHRMRVDVQPDGRRYVQAEALLLPGEIVLEQFEEFSTPWLYASYSDNGTNQMSEHFHAHVREVILGSRLDTARPVHLNTWEGIYFDHDPKYIMEMATQSANMGVERFIIDDGWFTGRDGEKAALGDWFLDETKYPDGLEQVVSHVNDLGMEFGLWFEPEMINKDSNLYREHPEYLLGVDGYEQPTGRYQYAIDLQNTEAFDYLLERLSYFLSTYNIDYIKWDMNREIVQPGHDGYAAGHKQVEKFYELVDRLSELHPTVEIESCASGGGRVDYEVLKRAHRFWPSDNNDALERQTIEKGMSYFFPPEVMGSHIGARTSHCSARTHNINFRGLSALFGHMGIELDPVKESEEEKLGFMKYIALHKEHRDLLHSGTHSYWPTDDAVHQIRAVVSKDKEEAIVGVFQMDMPTNEVSGYIRIGGLKEESMYTVELVDHGERFEKLAMVMPKWIDSDQAISGEWLEKVGLATPVMDSESAILLHIKEV